MSAHAPRIRARICGRSRSGSRSVTFLSLWRWQRCTSACSPNTSLIALRSALPPSITNRIACSGSRPRSTRSASSIETSVAFSVLPSQSPSGIFTPSVEIPSATTCVRSAISSPSSIITARRTSSSRRLISSPSAVRVRSMNSSDTVALRRRARCPARPPRRPARRRPANLRVETPASIRSITARVSGSRSAKYS